MPSPHAMLYFYDKYEATRIQRIQFLAAACFLVVASICIASGPFSNHTEDARRALPDCSLDWLQFHLPALSTHSLWPVNGRQMCCFVGCAGLSGCSAQRVLSAQHMRLVSAWCILRLCSQRVCSRISTCVLSVCAQLVALRVFCSAWAAQLSVCPAFLSLTLIVLCRSSCHGRSASGLEGHASRCDLDAREDVQLPGDSPSFLGCNDEPMCASSCPQVRQSHMPTFLCHSNSSCLAQCSTQLMDFSSLLWSNWVGEARRVCHTHHTHGLTHHLIAHITSRPSMLGLQLFSQEYAHMKEISFAVDQLFSPLLL